MLFVCNKRNIVDTNLEKSWDAKSFEFKNYWTQNKHLVAQMNKDLFGKLMQSFINFILNMAITLVLQDSFVDWLEKQIRKALILKIY